MFFHVNTRNGCVVLTYSSVKHSYDGSCHRFSPIVRDSATTRRDRSSYSTTAVDRRKHCRSVASWPHRNQSYDQEIVGSVVTVALDKLMCDVDPSLANYDCFMMIVQATSRQHIPQENRNKYYPRLTWANATIIIQLSEYMNIPSPKPPSYCHISDSSASYKYAWLSLKFH